MEEGNEQVGGNAVGRLSSKVKVPVVSVLGQRSLVELCAGCKS